MAGRLLTLGARISTRRLAIPFGTAGAHQDASLKSVIGNREVVGYGINGEPGYMDRIDFPMPALRWKENTADVLALREKEKGDWRKLSAEEKKALYRAAFCQTFAEFTAPTGEWKSIVGCTLFLTACGIWLYIFLKLFVYSPLPSSFSEDRRRAQLRRMLDIQVNPIEGVSSLWDQEKDEWKK